MSSREFVGMAIELDPITVLALGLRLRDTADGQHGLAACADTVASRNGSLPTPYGSGGDTDSGEAGASLLP